MGSATSEAFSGRVSGELHRALSWAISLDREDVQSFWLDTGCGWLDGGCHVLAEAIARWCEHHGLRFEHRCIFRRLDNVVEHSFVALLPRDAALPVLAVDGAGCRRLSDLVKRWRYSELRGLVPVGHRVSSRRPVEGFGSHDPFDVQKLYAHLLTSLRCDSELLAYAGEAVCRVAPGAGRPRSAR